MKETELIGQTDAMVWAEEFVKRVKKNPDIPTDESTMVGWFACAINSGYDEGFERGRRDASFELALDNRTQTC